MTTEIVVLNRLGVALATDSAVTISDGDRTKIFNTADKLFELSPVHPVGIMVNGNMDCMGVPWEIIIKDFREQCGRNQRRNSREWLEAFLKFVETYPTLNKSIADRNRLNQILNICNQVKDRFLDKILETSRKSGRLDKSMLVEDLLLSVIDTISKHYDSLHRADSLSDITADEVCEIYQGLYERVIPRIFERRLSEEEYNALINLITKGIMSTSFSDYSSGIVVAGYGSDSVFPSVASVEVDGLIKERLKYTTINTEDENNAGDIGRVFSFAQTDVTERLLGGADPEFIERTADYIEKSFRTLASDIEQKFRPRRVRESEDRTRSKIIAAAAKAVADEYLQKTSQELKKQLTIEFDRMIALMPKQEIIDLAEALVSITAAERKATSDEGTVGGPVDVALITKHEGFVWIKRKYYFDGHLNPRYFWRRYDPAAAAQAHEGQS